MDIDLNNDFDFEVDAAEEQYCSEDGSMYVMLDGNEPALIPDDRHTLWGEPVTKWLKRNPKTFYAEIDGDDDYEIALENAKEEAAGLSVKVKRYELAIKLFEKAGGTLDHLRHAPHVIENYTPNSDGDGDVTRYFIFKEENNGNTYRVVDQKEY